MENKYCKDCKHVEMETVGIFFKKRVVSERPHCLHPKTVFMYKAGNLVKGLTDAVALHYCEDERGRSYSACGREGKLWESNQ